jgi:hypothetical protein
MWTTIHRWFRTNEQPLTWFIIGVFAMCFIMDIGKQNYFGALLDLIIIAINYTYRPR